jgi:hypothetical protein
MLEAASNVRLRTMRTVHMHACAVAKAITRAKSLWLQA